MFEEVPAERRGVARLLPVRRIVLGPFVLGGGMLLAAVGGSVAVAAAAATMITASAIGYNDAPARPGHPVSSASSPQQTLAARRPPVHPQRATPAASSAAGQTAVTHPSGRAPAVSAGVPRSAGTALPAPIATPTSRPPVRSSTSTMPPSSPASSPSPTPSTTAPLGNAVIHVNGYDQASGRLAYQFAAQAGTGSDGGDQYQILDSDTFTAALAPSITITSDGGICPAAGATCTRDQLIQAADSGFFAVVAIDADGDLRSIVEVGFQPPSPKLAPAPSSSDSQPVGPSPAASSTPSPGS